MPTGYTAFIKDGEIKTGKDFLKLCTRAFGIAMEIRDEPLSVPTPNHFEPNPYYLKNYHKAVAALEEAKKMTIDEARREMQINHDHELERYKKTLREYESINAKYEAIKKEIAEWIPPTEGHVELKNFARNQIDISFENTRWYKQEIARLEKEIDLGDEAVTAYISERIDFAKEEVERARKAWQKEVKRAEDKNKWIDEFYRSIGE